MHPLDLSPRGNSSRSSYSSKSSSQVEYNNSHQQDIIIHRKNKLGNKREPDQGKRGRPRADILTTLMVEGSSSRSKIRCVKCGRAFPREKSLQAHVRTHTGEKPYPCDYPGCTKAFCQSGQLKTHQRLHTGEKPFACNVNGCASRFTHANRHCSSHPYAGLRRLEVNLGHVAKLNENQGNAEVKRWIDRYVRQSSERINAKLSPKKSTSLESPPPASSQIQPKGGGQGHSLSLPVNQRRVESKSPPIKFHMVHDEKITPLDLTRTNRSPSLPKLSPIGPPPSSSSSLSSNHHVFPPPPPLIPIITQPSSATPTPAPALVALTPNSLTSSSTDSLSYGSPSPTFYNPSFTSPLPSSYTAYTRSSTSSSFSSSTSSSSPSSASTPSLHRHQHHHHHPLATSLTMSEKKDDFYPYVFSSQMVLQGHPNIGSSPLFSHCFPFPNVTTYNKPTSLSLASPVSEQRNAPVRTKEKEKDRYISALALIELSKG